MISIPKTNKMTSEEPFETCRIFNDKYELLSSIGKNRECELFLGQDINDVDKQVYLKIYDQDYMDQKENRSNMKKEMQIHSSLSHPHI